MMKLIDGDDFWRRLLGHTEEDWVDLMVVRELLDKMPNLDSVKGKAEWRMAWHPIFRQNLPWCSVCGKAFILKTDYCPFCGCLMRMEGEDEDVN